MLDYNLGDPIVCKAPAPTHCVTTNSLIVRRRTWSESVCPDCQGELKQRKVNGKYVLTCVRRCGE